MSGHPSYCRLNSEEQQKVYQMSEADKIRQDNLKDHIPIQALLDELKEENFEYNYQYDQNNHLTHLFFAHPILIILTKAYSSVFLMDCIYKTNKFRMPLLHVVKMTSFNTIFFSCFAFLKSEQKEGYEWALVRIAHIFTDISKPQHIEKNVLSNCCQYLLTEDELREFLRSVTKVSVFSLKKVHEQFLKVTSTTSENSLQPCIAHQQTTALDEISSLFQESAIVVQDPWEQHTRGCLVGARNAQSSI
ncbi:5455_t:CDS:2 [Cetraspora pellucida]|uniref:5455_t:CDS:1 n=1 Tax=Cetraspora pellucida TaxID=1433469 RepID=A0A9N9G8L4_9GLOM|nr:5455_t:CDS:2 [Cetraspora pellucida]